MTNDSASDGGNKDTEPWLESVSGNDLPRLITSNSPVIRVVAGPGSGKTLGLKRRVQRLIQKDGVDPSKIFVGTFTRSIAEDLSNELGDEVAQGVEVSTIHSLAYKLLRENPAAIQGRPLRFLHPVLQVCHPKFLVRLTLHFICVRKE